MPSLLSSILKSVNLNVNKDNKMNILCLNEDEQFQFNIAKTGHNFYYIQPSKMRPWDTNIIEKPSNCYFLKGDSLQNQLKQDTQFDLILCQNKFTQFGLLSEMSKQLSCPIILAEHNLSDPKLDPYVVDAANNQEYNHYVFNSNFLADSCGLDKEDVDVSIVNCCIDIDRLEPWDKKYNTVCGVSVGNDNIQYITGSNIFKEISSDFEIDIADPKDGHKIIVGLYKTCGVFLNTSQWLVNPKMLLEAMAAGCPVVTTDTANISSIIENDVNGYITNDIGEINTYLNRILQDRDLATRLGDMAKKTILDKFSVCGFVNKWNDVFANTIGTTSIIFKGNKNATVEY